MRVMVIVKANKESEAGQMPSEQLLTEMGKFNEALSKAGVLLAADGLHPTSKGKRVRFSGSNRTVTVDPASQPPRSASVIMAPRPASRSPRENR